MDLFIYFIFPLYFLFSFIVATFLIIIYPRQKSYDNIDNSSNTSLIFYGIISIQLINLLLYTIIFDFSIKITLYILLFTLISSYLLGNHMRLIGITGQISSGKSTFSKILKKKGEIVIDIDEINKKVLEEVSVKKEIYKIFGEEAFICEDKDSKEDNIMNILKRKLNKEKIRMIIYTDKDKKSKLERITHFKVLLRFIVQVLYWKCLMFRKRVYVENGILLRISLNYNICFPIISIICNNKESIIKRVMDRDGSSREVVLNILNNQMNTEEYKKRSDYIIINDGELNEFIENINRYYDEIK